MARRKYTYQTKLNTDRRPTIDSQGRFHFRGEIQSGDPGRPTDLAVTEEELEWALKSARDVRLRHATDRVRQEQGQQMFELQRQLRESNRRIDDLDGRNKELEQAIDGAHAVAHKDQKAPNDQADRFAFVKHLRFPKTS